jgi:hypothetical protein
MAHLLALTASAYERVEKLFRQWAADNKGCGLR